MRKLLAMSDAIRNVLVTGGAGYIGSVLVGLLLRKDYRVRTIDNLSFGGSSLLSYLPHPHFEFIKGDICRAADVREAVGGMDAVIHLAAIVGDPACKQKPELAVRVNKEGSEMLCEMAIERNVKRFVFASTCSNYGRMADSDDFVNEDSELRPVSLYAELKVGFEQYLAELGLDDYTPVCMRFATGYGLSPRPRFDLTVNEFTRELAMGNRLEVYGERSWRPYCHAIDLSRACLMSLKAERTAVAYQAFNVGANEENYRKQSLVKMILDELPEAGDRVRYVPRGEDPRDYRVDFSKIHSTLGFSVTRKVSDGIREITKAIASGLIRNPRDRCFSNL